MTPKPTGKRPQRGEKPLAPGSAIHLMSNSVLVYMRCVCVRVPRATSSQYPLGVEGGPKRWLAVGEHTIPAVDRGWGRARRARPLWRPPRAGRGETHWSAAGARGPRVSPAGMVSNGQPSL